MFYIQAGLYRRLNDHNREFKIVGPLDMPPYIMCDPEKIFHLTKHHSHTYRLNDDCTTAFLHKKSNEAELNGTMAPYMQELTTDQTFVLKEAIEKGKVY